MPAQHAFALLTNIIHAPEVMVGCNSKIESFPRAIQAKHLLSNHLRYDHEYSARELALRFLPDIVNTDPTMFKDAAQLLIPLLQQSAYWPSGQRALKQALTGPLKEYIQQEQLSAWETRYAGRTWANQETGSLLLSLPPDSIRNIQPYLTPEDQAAAQLFACINLKM